MNEDELERELRAIENPTDKELVRARRDSRRANRSRSNFFMGRVALAILSAMRR